MTAVLLIAVAMFVVLAAINPCREGISKCGARDLSPP